MQKKKLTQTCPKCNKGTLIVSIFGTICSNCFYEPVNILKNRATAPVKKHPIVFKHGTNKIRIPLLPPLDTDGIVTLDAPKIINDALKHFKPRKNVRIDLNFTIGTEGKTMEVTISKK